MGFTHFFLPLNRPVGGGYSFRCCFQRPEVSDYIVDADSIAVGFLSAVLTGDIPAVEEPFCFAFADAADAV